MKSARYPELFITKSPGALAEVDLRMLASVDGHEECLEMSIGHLQIWYWPIVGLFHLRPPVPGISTIGYIVPLHIFMNSWGYQMSSEYSYSTSSLGLS